MLLFSVMLVQMSPLKPVRMVRERPPRIEAQKEACLVRWIQVGREANPLKDEH